MEQDRVGEIANQVFRSIKQVTAEEFYWQDANFNSNVRRGRELLYLIANDEWIPSTTERIDVSRADQVGTDLVLDVDLGKIRHEAFRGEGGPAWLPLLVLPLPLADDDLTGDLRVTDAGGALRTAIPLQDVRHAMSAALAEMIIGAAVTHWPADRDDRPPADRDVQLLLSAAMFPVLNGAIFPPPDEQDGGDSAIVHDTARIKRADDTLGILLSLYVDQMGAAGPDAPVALAQRLPDAAEVLDALRRAVVVAVTASRRLPPSVFTVTTPPRPLGEAEGVRPDWLSWLRPIAELQVDLLLPSASADRYVEASLPEGVSLREGTPKGMVVRVKRPRSVAMLSELITQIVSGRSPEKDPGTGESAAAEIPRPAEVLCLADLARAKAASLSHHAFARDEVRKQLNRLTGALTALTDAPGRPNEGMLKDLATAWKDGAWLGDGLLRETKTSRENSGARTLTGVAHPGRYLSDPAEPEYARVVVPVQATEVRYVAIARLAGTMSAVMMIVLGFFFALPAVSGRGSPSLNPAGVGAVASAITLFAVILAGRTDMPDRSLLRGYLSARGNVFIVASVLPSIVLAIALAFDTSGWVPVRWTGITLAVQIALWLGMSPWILYGRKRRPRGRGRPPRIRRRQPRVLETPAPDESSPASGYQRAHVLRSVWWRTTTANALVKNHPAFGYIVWGSPAPEPLMSVLPGGEDVLGPGEGPNILSMLHVTFGARPMTFLVFRDPPGDAWTRADRTDIHLNAGEQASIETPPDEIDIFVGSPATGSAASAVRKLCGIAADKGLIVLNVRLPEPPPGGDPGRDWARLRLGLREGESAGLRSLLHAVSAAMTNDPPCRDCHVLVRTARGGRMRFVYPPDRAGTVAAAAGTRTVRASDLDPVESTGARYRVLALHATAHIGVERQVFGRLAKTDPDLDLVAITYAILHGTSVFLLLGRVRRRPLRKDRSDVVAALAAAVSEIGVHVDIDQVWKGADLGTAGNAPLLRVLLRTPDRQGALRDVAEALADALPDDCRPPMDFWHGVLESGAAPTTTVRLTRQLPPAADLSRWNAGLLRDIEHRTRTGLTRRAAERQARLGGDGADFGAPEDAVVDIRLIKSGAPLRPGSNRRRRWLERRRSPLGIKGSVSSITCDLHGHLLHAWTRFTEAYALSMRGVRRTYPGSKDAELT